MKILQRICLLLLMSAMLLSVAIPVYGEVDTLTQSYSASGSVGLDAQIPVGGTQQVLETAKAAVLFELTGNTMVYAWNPDEIIDPSGMNKLLTAIIALENCDPQEMVTVSRTVVQSAALIGSVSAELKVGEELKMIDLLYCMMVKSANDAAVVIAEHISGTEEAFVELMNRRAAELGCQNTHFVNASGLPQQGQYTTARDLAKITVAGLENELFSEMFSAVEYTVPKTNKKGERRIVTSNYLMSKETVKTQFDSRVTGGKTGALSTTDRSIVCTAENSGKRYLVVLMSARGTVTEDGLSVKTFGSFEETRALLDYGFYQFSYRQVLQAGQVLGQYAVDGCENAAFAGPGVDLFSALPTEVDSTQISFRCVLNRQLAAPMELGEVIGTAEVWYQNICVGYTPLLLLNSLRTEDSHIQSLIPSAQPQQSQSLRNWLILGGLILVGLLLVAGMVLVVILLVRKHQMDRRHRLINEGMDR